MTFPASRGRLGAPETPLRASKVDRRAAGPARPAPAPGSRARTSQGQGEGHKRPALGAWVPERTGEGASPAGDWVGRRRGLAAPGRSDGYEEAEWAWLRSGRDCGRSGRGLGKGRGFTKGRGSGRLLGEARLKGSLLGLSGEKFIVDVGGARRRGGVCLGMKLSESDGHSGGVGFKRVIWASLVESPWWKLGFPGC